MKDVYDYALIITHNRPEDLETCIKLIAPQVGSVLVLDNASDPPVRDDWDCNVTVVHIPLQPPNIAYMWNLGLDYIERGMSHIGVKRWNVAMLCDDVVVPEDWVERLSRWMRHYEASAVSAHNIREISQPIVHYQPNGDIYNRMHGAAFILNGEHNLRADESMKWWWCDTDLDWQARVNGGTVIAPGPIATNTKPNDFTNSKPELGAQTGVDGAAFAAKWGGKPW